MYIKIIPKEDFDSIIPFLEMLNNNTDKQILIERLNAMKESNYKCVGVFDNEKLIGISGIWLLCKHYVGKHIEPDNVIVDPSYRGKKIGEMLMEWIHNYARENDYPISELNCYVANHRGHKFWISQGYEIIAYHMRKTL